MNYRASVSGFLAEIDRMQFFRNWARLATEEAATAATLCHTPPYEVAETNLLHLGLSGSLGRGVSDSYNLTGSTHPLKTEGQVYELA